MTYGELSNVVYIATIFSLILVLVFITQIVLLIRFRDMNNKKLDEMEKRIQDNERLARIQVEVNNEIISLTTHLNKLFKNEIVD